MNNVVVFPKARKNIPLQSIDEIIESVEESRKEHIEYLMDEILPMIFGVCGDNGFDIASDECVKTTALFMETFRATLYQSAGLDHSLHKLANEVVNIVDENGETEVSSE